MMRDKAIIAGAVLCGLAIVAIAANTEIKRYHETFEAAERDTRNAATLAAAHAAQVFDGVESTLRGVRSLRDDVVAGRIRDPDSIQTLLNSLRGNGMVVHSVGWTDAAGIQQGRSSPVPAKGPVNMSRSEHFTFHRDAARRGAPPGLHISRPLHARATGRWLIIASRPILDPQGHFDGTTGAAVDPLYFTTLYQHIELGPSRAATLYRNDGVVLSRAPSPDTWIGKVDPADKVLFADKIRHATAGTFVRPAGGGRAERIISFRTVPNLPLVITFSLRVSDVLAPFYADLKVALATVALALALLAAGARFVFLWQRERRLAHAALAESEARYRDLVNTTDGIVWEADPVSLDFTFVSDKAERLLGYPGKAWLTPGFWAAHIHPDDRAWVTDRRAASVARREGNDIEYRFLAADGRTVWLRDLVTIAAEGKTAHWLRGIMVDTTRSRLAEDALRRSQKMDAVGQLTGGIAHDFNNLLGIILTHVGILEEIAGGDSDVRRGLDAIAKSVRRGADLTRRLLGFARERPHEPKRISVNAFIAGMEGLIRKSLTPAIRVETMLDDDAWPVEADPGDLEDAILNLSLNARDAMSDGGSLMIETANKVIDRTYVERNPGSATGDFLMIAVSDTGSGMPGEVAERAFEPFFTTKPEGQGTGLGLSMVYGFVRRSGGHAKIYSEAGQGTTVRLYLPRAHEMAETPDVQDIEATDLPPGAETVLVVDDEPALVEAADRFLTALGYRTLSAANAETALDRLRADPEGVDLLFSDVIMPGMDGYQLAIAALKVRPGLKVLLTSGFSRRREQFINGEAEIARDLTRNLLSKPYNLAELAHAVRRALDS